MNINCQNHFSTASTSNTLMTVELEPFWGEGEDLGSLTGLLLGDGDLETVTGLFPSGDSTLETELYLELVVEWTTLGESLAVSLKKANRGSRIWHM